MSKTVKWVMVGVIAVAVLAVIVAGVMYWQNRGSDSTTNGNTNGTTNTNGNTTNGNTNNANTNSTLTNTTGGGTTPDTTTPQSDSERILRLARTFVERYGTFSNRNNFENITALEPYMSDRFQQESAAYINDQQNAGIGEDFYSIISTVISTTVQDLKEGESAIVRVGTQRTETRGTETPAIFTQHARLNFINVEGTWKVDSLTWE